MCVLWLLWWSVNAVLVPYTFRVYVTAKVIHSFRVHHKHPCRRPLVLRALVDAGLGFLAKVRKLAAISCQCVGTLAVSAYAQDPNEEKIATREAAWAEVKSDQEQIRDSDSPRSQAKMQVIDSSQSPARFGMGRPSSRPSLSFPGQVLLALLLLLCPSADAAGVICHKYGDNGTHLTGPPSGLPVVWDVNHSGVPRHGFVGLNHVARRKFWWLLMATSLNATPQLSALFLVWDLPMLSAMLQVVIKNDMLIERALLAR